MLPPENNNQTRASVLTSMFNTVLGVLVCLLTSLFQNKRERKKRHSDGKGRGKPVLICRWLDHLCRKSHRI